VIAVGPGVRDKTGTIIPTQVKAGDRVLLPGWGGNSIKVGEEVCGLCFLKSSRNLTSSIQEYFLFKDAEILAKIKE
jgi:chaperonin GroES